MYVFDATTAEWKRQEQKLPNPLFSHGCNKVTLKDGRNGILTVGGFTTEGVPAVSIFFKILFLRMVFSKRICIKV